MAKKARTGQVRSKAKAQTKVKSSKKVPNRGKVKEPLKRKSQAKVIAKKKVEDKATKKGKRNKAVSGVSARKISSRSVISTRKGQTKKVTSVKSPGGDSRRLSKKSNPKKENKAKKKVPLLSSAPKKHRQSDKVSPKEVRLKTKTSEKRLQTRISKTADKAKSIERSSREDSQARKRKKESEQGLIKDSQKLRADHTKPIVKDKPVETEVVKEKGGKKKAVSNDNIVKSLTRREQSAGNEAARSEVVANPLRGRRKSVVIADDSIKVSVSKKELVESQSSVGTKGQTSKASTEAIDSKKDGVKIVITESINKGTPATFVNPLYTGFRSLAMRLQKTEEKPKKPKGRFLAIPPKKGKQYALDLRIHSPGTQGFFSTGGVDPGAAFVRLAKVKGLDMMAVTDYNNAEFIDVVKSQAANSKLTVIPGVDLRCKINSCDEIYLIALFPDSYGSAEVFKVLFELGVPRWARGKEEYCLDKDFSEIVRIVESNAGVLIPTRVDKTPFRQLALPTLIDEYGLHAFDLVHPENTEVFKTRWPNGEFTFFCFSNANSLAQLGSRIEKVKLTKPGFEGIRELVQRRKSLSENVSTDKVTAPIQEPSLNKKMEDGSKSDLMV